MKPFHTTTLKQPCSKRPVLYYQALWFGHSIDEDRDKRVLTKRYRGNKDVEVKPVS